MQYFHWYLPPDHRLWKKFAHDAKWLSDIGITHVWLPPAYKGSSGGYSVGYDPYDLYDLGEFDQKGSVPTKYGTRDEYLEAIKIAHQNKLEVIADVVFNHKAGADELEKFKVIKVNPENRNEFISEPFEIEAWTKFYFPARQGKYSDYVWDHMSFTGIDWAHDIGENGVYSIQNEYGEGWEDLTHDELGNYDYLMYADVEFRNPAVREELKRWGEWYLSETGVDGFRFDALKHITPHFINDWVDHMNSKSPRKLFYVGEYWDIHSAISLKNYLAATEHRIQLFDAPLVHNFHVASRMGREYDLRHLLDNTLVKEFPEFAITLVANHDTQPLQALENPVEDWFRPLAHSIILLREQGIPCIFFPAIYGADYEDIGRDGNTYPIHLSKLPNIEKMLGVRRHLAYGRQRDYFNHTNTIGWTREGLKEKRGSGCAVLLSNGDDGFKKMKMGKKNANRVFVDIVGGRQEQVTIDEHGEAEFHCYGRSVSVWIDREMAPKFNQ